MGIAERREREREQRRNSIIDAAERAFLRKGLDAAKMEEIADEAELSKSALYLHFKGKDELILGSVQRSFKQFEDSIENENELSPDKADNGLEELHQLLQILVRFATSNPHSIKLTMGLMTSQAAADYRSSNFEHYSGAIERNIERSVAAVVRGQEDGSVRKDIDAHLVVRQIWASLMGVLLADSFNLPPPKSITPGAITPGFLDLLLDALKPGADR